MSRQAPGRLPYDPQTITQNAPPLSGVYAIFSPSECLYVGASDDICASLLEIYYEDQPWLNDEHLAHFSFDLVSPDSRGARQTDRIRELQPVCNLGVGVPGVRPSSNGTAGKAGGRRAGELETKGKARFSRLAGTSPEWAGPVQLEPGPSGRNSGWKPPHFQDVRKNDQQAVPYPGARHDPDSHRG